MTRLLVAGAVLAHAAEAGAQITTVDTLARARQLRDAGDFAAAAAILGPYVQAHPDDPGSARFAALMAYWAKDPAAADSVYAAAVLRHPGDPELRLEYAQFLIERRNEARALDVLAPFSAEARDQAPPFTPTMIARGQTLLGTLAYWNGDFVRARRSFIRALRADSSLADARRQLREIEVIAAPWARVGIAGWDDDQPLARYTTSVEGGWSANALTPLALRARSLRFDADEVRETATLAEATVATYFPRARVDVQLGGGVLARTFGDGSDWTGRMALGRRITGLGSLQLEVERAPYLNTTHSIAEPVMTRSIEGSARWNPSSGWLGEAVVRREYYPDDNDVTTAYAWALAPLIRRQRGVARLGYSISAQSAASSRFIQRDDAVNFPPGQAPPTVRGWYDPYYTPRNLRVQSALGSVRLQPGGRWSVNGDVAYAVHARDDAPVLVVVPSPPDVDIVRAYYDRRFTPWNVRGGIDAAATDAIRLGLTAEHGRGAYYRYTTVGAQLTYTFVAAARRRADAR